MLLVKRALLPPTLVDFSLVALLCFASLCFALLCFATFLFCFAFYFSFCFAFCFALLCCASLCASRVNPAFGFISLARCRPERREAGQRPMDDDEHDSDERFPGDAGTMEERNRDQVKQTRLVFANVAAGGSARGMFLSGERAERRDETCDRCTACPEGQ